MTAARRWEDLPPELQDLSFFADRSAFTMQQHRQLATITKPLNNHQIPYKWLYPAKLLVTKGGNNFVIASVKESLCLMREWKILVPNTAEDTLQSPSASSDAETGWKPNSLISHQNTLWWPRRMPYSSFLVTPQVKAVVIPHRFHTELLVFTIWLVSFFVSLLTFFSQDLH